MTIIAKRALFNAENEIAAYYFTINTLSNEDAGYIIIDADKTKFPVIEYSDKGKAFLEKAEKEVNENEVVDDVLESSKLMYLGNLDYCVNQMLQSGTEKIYDISTVDYNEINKNDIQDNEKQENISSYKYDKTMGSEPENGGNNIITNPYDGESGYADFTYDGWWNAPSSTYIRIADGWSSSSDRYVWGNCYGTWNYIDVIQN